MAVIALCAAATAWLSEDACISLRTVVNVLDGHGLRWNVDERVQTYTHPLWLLVLIAANALGRVFLTSGDSAYYATLAACWLCTVATAVLLVVRLPMSTLLAILAAAGLLLSRASVDWSSSGLENALAHLLAALFVTGWQAWQPSPRRALALALCAGFAACNRLDHAVLYAPAIAFLLWRQRGHRLQLLLTVTAPVLAWWAFALVYYGHPLPITYYGKLGGGVDHGYLLARALEYCADSLHHDPLTLVTIVVAIVLAVRSPHWRPLGLGLLCYLLYLGWIGGCYLAGRMFSTPFTLSLAVLAVSLSHRRALAALLLTLLLGSVSGWPRWLDFDYAIQPEPTADSVEDHCGRCRPMSGLLSPLRNPFVPGQLAPPALVDDDRGAPLLRVHQAIGLLGLLSGPRVHLVDPVLTDPVLVFLPNFGAAPIRRCHYARRIPRGYLRTLADGKNHLEHPGLAAFADSKLYIAHAPLFDAPRWTEIWRQLTGFYAEGLQGYVSTEYQDTAPEVIDLATVATPVAEGQRWTRGTLRVLDVAGLRVRLLAVSQCRELALTLDCADRYGISFFRGEELLAQTEVTTPDRDWSGAHAATVAVPAVARERGFDAVQFEPRLPSTDFIWALGHLECRD